MRRFKNILVVYDRFRGSRGALDHAISLAANNNAELTVALCLSEFDATVPADLVDTIIRGLHAHLQSLLDPGLAKGVNAQILTLRGRPFIQIIRTVLSAGHDLVIKSAGPDRDENGAARPFGSTELHLLRKCPCPVWILREDEPKAAQRVIAAVGPGFTRPEERQLDIRIMEIATSLAARENADVHALTVFETPDERLTRYLGITDRAELEDMCRRNAAIVDEEFRVFVDRFSRADHAITASTAIGTPADHIEAATDANPANIVVMATTRSAGTPGFFFGATAEGVLRQCVTGVLAIKPPGFVSPVAGPLTD